MTLALRLLSVFAALAIFAALAPARATVAFGYDAAKPLDVRPYGPTRVIGGVTVRDITYASPMGGRVPAYIVEPLGKAPFAAIVYGHWAIGTREEFLFEAIAMAKRGILGVLPDAPFVRPTPWAAPAPGSDPSKPQTTVATYEQSVVDLRRAIDLARSQPGVDRRRVAYVGHSYDADMGGIVAGVDHRLRAVVLMAGSGNLVDISSAYAAGAIFAEQNAAAARSLPKRMIAHYTTVVQQVNPDRFVGRATAPIFMQFARQDAYVSRAAASDYLAHAAPSTKVKWYLGGHELNDPRAMRDRDGWLEEHLKHEGRSDLVQI